MGKKLLGLSVVIIIILFASYLFYNYLPKKQNEERFNSLIQKSESLKKLLEKYPPEKSDIAGNRDLLDVLERIISEKNEQWFDYLYQHPEIIEKSSDSTKEIRVEYKIWKATSSLDNRIE